MYIVSECLLGKNVKYNGRNNQTEWVKEFAKKHNCFSCCPEMLGGLPCPRLPSEIKGYKIISSDGTEVSDYFFKGAEIALKRAKEEAEKLGEKIEGAILKSRSPSCGKDYIYDGTFSGKLVAGEGAFAKLLKKNNICIYTEKEKIDD